MRRAEDWMTQADYNFEHAQESLKIGHFDWACFAAQQAAELAVKALFRSLGAEAWGHSISQLLLEIPNRFTPQDDVLSSARLLDRLYIPVRYPNGLPSGTPREAFDENEAKEAMEAAKTIIGFCKSKMAEIER